MAWGVFLSDELHRLIFAKAIARSGCFVGLLPHLSVLQEFDRKVELEISVTKKDNVNENVFILNFPISNPSGSGL